MNSLSKELDKALELSLRCFSAPLFSRIGSIFTRASCCNRSNGGNDRTDSIEAREWNRVSSGGREADFTSSLSTKKSIESITREDLVAFHKRFYSAG